MAENDILNPTRPDGTPGYLATLGDNPNPSYGFTRKTNANSLLSKTRLGSWYQRDNANSGYAFPMSYMLRPWTTMLRLKQFYEIGKNGYFTVIDYDGGSRHHVGRFTTAPNPIQMQNAKYNCQNLIFEEIPQARMLTYPTDYTDWAKNIFAVDDSLKQTAAFQGNWLQQQSPLAVLESMPVTSPSSYEMYDAEPASTDFIQVQYVGWGFQLSMRMGAGLGLCDVYVDGALCVQGLDLYAGTAANLMGYQTLGIGGALAPPIVTISQTLALTTYPVGSSSYQPAAQILYPVALGGTLVPIAPGPPVTTYSYQVSVTMPAMPLDSHRVKVVPRNAKNSASSGTGVAYGGLQVIV